MTDTLTRDEVNDTGEIRHEPGQTTTNLTYITQGPALRRPDATFEIPVIDADFQSDTPRHTQPNPDPLPPPPPPTPVVDDRPLSEGEEIPWTQATPAEALGVYRDRRSVAYVMSASRQPGPRGRHRKAKKDPAFGWLTLAVQRILNAIVIGGGR